MSRGHMIPEYGAPLDMFVIYRNPLDYPGKYVIRRHTVTQAGSKPDPEPLGVVDSLDEARAVVPPGSYNIGRYDMDEPQIVEVWV